MDKYQITHMIFNNLNVNPKFKSLDHTSNTNVIMLTDQDGKNFTLVVQDDNA